MAAFDVQPINYQVSIVDEKGRMTMQFQLFLQNLIKQLKGKFGELDAALLEQALIDVAEATVAAQDAATGAQDAADNAQTAADDTAAASSLASSGASGLTITGADAGANARINISAHTRVYGDGTSVAVNAGQVLGLAYSTIYYVYYVDPARAGGAVTYQASTNANNAIQIGNTHSLGTVETPAAAGPSIPGRVNPPPGVQTWA